MQDLPSSSMINIPAFFEAEDYKFIKKFRDKRFGKAKLLKNKNSGMPVFSIKKMYDSKTSAIPEVQRIENRRGIVCKFYNGPLQFDLTEISDLCSSFYQLETYYKYISNDLRKEIQMKTVSHQVPTDEEIVHLMYDTISCMAYLQSHNITHGCLLPELILKDKKNYKIIEQISNHLAPGETNLCDLRNLNVEKDNCYLSPEGFRAYSKFNTIGASKPPRMRPVDYVRNDVFVLGLILLEYGVLQCVQKCFDWVNCEFEVRNLEYFIGLLEKNYPENTLLCSTVKKMLSIDVETRPDFGMIYSRLPEYESVKGFFQKQNQDRY